LLDKQLQHLQLLRARDLALPWVLLEEVLRVVWAELLQVGAQVKIMRNLRGRFE
jgi:hypothetical protein